MGLELPSFLMRLLFGCKLGICCLLLVWSCACVGGLDDDWEQIWRWRFWRCSPECQGLCLESQLTQLKVCQDQLSLSMSFLHSHGLLAALACIVCICWCSCSHRLCGLPCVVGWPVLQLWLWLHEGFEEVSWDRLAPDQVWSCCWSCTIQCSCHDESYNVTIGSSSWCCRERRCIAIKGLQYGGDGFVAGHSLEDCEDCNWKFGYDLTGNFWYNVLGREHHSDDCCGVEN